MRVAICQHEPVLFDLDACLNKLENLLAEAAGTKAQLAVVGETWLSGYPAFLDYVPNVALWDYTPMRTVFARMHHNALRIPSPQFERLQHMVRTHGLALVVGCNEAVATGPGSGTLYNTLLVLDKNGALRVHHRKLMPTYTEKILYGLGDGQGLQTTEIQGVKVGGLICWEHWMPHARQALHNAAEDVHIALWPTVHDLHQLASRHYAFEGRCCVVAVGQIQRVAQQPTELTLPPELANQPDKLLLRGGSCAIGPDGMYVAEPVFDQEKTMLVELPIHQNIGYRLTLDVSGHYARPDVFGFSVNKNRPS